VWAQTVAVVHKIPRLHHPPKMPQPSARPCAASRPTARRLSRDFSRVTPLVMRKNRRLEPHDGRTRAERCGSPSAVITAAPMGGGKRNAVKRSVRPSPRIRRARRTYALRLAESGKINFNKNLAWGVACMRLLARPILFMHETGELKSTVWKQGEKLPYTLMIADW
jgi:hypothetical protein